MQLAPSIFKAYDIRGIVPSTVDEAVAEALGRAFGTIALRGRDHGGRGARRPAERPRMCGALVRGLVAAGMQVIDVGLVTTPMLYFAASTLCTSGIQVTGSHNPKDYNGFKMVLRGRAIYGDEIQALRHDGERDLAAAGPAAACARWTCWRPTASASWATSSWRAR
jgi:phosphomannomutase